MRLLLHSCLLVLLGPLGAALAVQGPPLGVAGQERASPALPTGGTGPAAGRGALGRADRPAPSDVGPAAARRGGGPRHDLARARALFAAVDADEDARWSLAEGRAAGLLRRDFEAFDASRDGRIDPDEFTVGYRALVGASGRPVETDLLAEATRLEARRRVLDAQRSLERARSSGPAAQRQLGPPAAQRQLGPSTAQRLVGPSTAQRLVGPSTAQRLVGPLGPRSTPISNGPP